MNTDTNDIHAAAGPRRVYLDYAATTPVDARVLATMTPYFTEVFGNAASRHHAFGWDAADAVEAARSEVAGLIGAWPGEIVFTSGATESINLALKGVAEGCRARGRHIVTTAVEHSAVRDTCRHLEQRGYTVTSLPVDAEGVLDLDLLARSLTDETILLAVMAANNETGTVYPWAEIGRIARGRGVPFFTDATQAAGIIPIDVARDHIDLLAFSAHKLYGPKGVGALYVRGGAARTALAAQMHGGRHERGVRSGTVNVPGVVGFGAACRLAGAAMPEEARRVAALRDALEAAILQRIPAVYVNGSRVCRLPHITNLAFDGITSRALIRAIHPIAVSAGAACTRAEAGPSPVLKALGLDDDRAYASVRFSLGRFTTQADIDCTVRVLAEAVSLLRPTVLYKGASAC